MPTTTRSAEPVDLDKLRDVFIQHRVECGARVKARRQELGVRQGPIAKRVGVPVQTISKIERGDVMPRDYLKAAIAVVLGCAIDDLWPYPDRHVINAAA